MDPVYVKLESMKIAAQLLCCANDGEGSGRVFPNELGYEREFQEGDSTGWQAFVDSFFGLSDKIYEHAMLG